jgi:DNA-binding NarL/FixJ family response regulator
VASTDAGDRVARLVVHGRTNREIAGELGVTEKAIEWHLSRLFRQYGVRSRTELAVLILNRSRSDRNGESAGIVNAERRGKGNK